MWKGLRQLRLRWPFLLCVAVTVLPGRAFGARPRRSQLTIIDMDLVTGAMRVSGPDRSRASTPGSALKPLILLTALRLRAATPQTRIACNGSFTLAGRNLTCAHPASLGVLDAQEALAYSCNRYFATIAQQLTASEFQEALQRFGLHVSGPGNVPSERALMALGLDGIRVTPMELASAYAKLATALGSSDAAAMVTRRGMLDSVSYGMARAAQTLPLVLGGKTGTAHDPAPMLQHGWFAGIVFSADRLPKPLRVLVVYAPGGNGNDAAFAAHHYLQSGQAQ